MHNTRETRKEKKRDKERETLSCIYKAVVVNHVPIYTKYYIYCPLVLPSSCPRIAPMWLQNWLPTVHTFWHQYKATTKLSRAFKILRGLQEHIAIVSFARCDWIINPVYYPSLVFLALTPKQKRAASSGSKSKIYRAQVYLRTARVVHTEIKTAKKDHGRNGGNAESRAIAMKHTPCKKKQYSAQYRALGKRVSFASHTTKHM